MARNRSPNPRPRQQRRRREEEPAPEAYDKTQARDTGSEGAANASEGATAPPEEQPPSGDAATLMQQMFEFMTTSQRESQQQMAQMLQQQVLLQQRMLQAHVAGQRSQKKKGNPLTFNGQVSDDLELWLFSTEQYYSDYQQEMQSNSPDFVNTIFANLGPEAQTWYRDFKLSLVNQPATWLLFKQRIRERFRDSDFQNKVLTKLYNLRWKGSQQAYTTKFLHLMAQLDCELPEIVKRWFYQQNLRTETSAFVS